MRILTVLAFISLPVHALSFSLPVSPTDYDDCLIDELPQAQTTAAANMIRRACERRYAMYLRPPCSVEIQKLIDERELNDYTVSKVYEVVGRACRAGKCINSPQTQKVYDACY
jgi:hypothetical protein